MLRQTRLSFFNNNMTFGQNIMMIVLTFKFRNNYFYTFSDINITQPNCKNESDRVA